MNRLYYDQFTTSKDKMSQNTILARIFDLCQRLWQGLQGYLTSGKDYKDKSCPCKEKQGTRIRFHPCLRHHIFIERRKKRFLHIADGRKYYLKFSTSCQESLINPTLQKSVLVSASSKCFENA